MKTQKKIIKIQVTQKMIDEINDVREKCGFERQEKQPHELECLFG